MKPRSPIRKISLKRLSSLKGRQQFSTIRKKARKPSEFNRIYGSKARVEFVKSLPCVSCGVSGYSENAHIENGGTGRKADYTKIIALCGPHPTDMNRAGMTTGHHRVMHSIGCEEFARIYEIDLESLAAKTEAAYQSFLRRASLGSSQGGET